MKKNNTLLWIIGLIIAVCAIMYIGPKFGLFAMFEQEPGWISYGEFTTAFEGADVNHYYRFPSYYAEQTGTYWKFHQRLTNTYPTFKNGDRDIYFAVSGGDDTDGWIETSIPLMSKHFKFNYKMDADELSEVHINVFGFSQGISRGKVGNKVGTFEIVPSSLNPSEVSILIDGIHRGDYNLSQDEPLKIDFSLRSVTTEDAHLELFNFRYRPMFGCEMDNDEVLVFDDIQGGSTFSINDLSYPVRKFCYNHNPIIRSFTEHGLEQDYKSEIFDALSRGKSLTVPDDQVWRIPYITQIQGAILRCSLNEAWNVKTKQCENVLTEGVIEDKERIELVSIDVGKNEVMYVQQYDTPPLAIGSNIRFSGSTPSFSCCSKVSNGWINVGQPSNDCWQIVAASKTINPGETFEIIPYITAEYSLGGYGVYKGYKKSREQTYNCEFVDPEDWTNYFRISLDNAGIIISSTQAKDKFMLGDNESLSITVENKIATFDKAGVKIRTSTRLFDAVYEDFYPFEMIKGVNNYNIPLKTDVLGGASIEVIPYVEIMDKKLYDDNKIIFHYEVLNEADLEPKEIKVETDGDIVTQYVCPDGKIVNQSSDCYIEPKQKLTSEEGKSFLWIYILAIVLLVLYGLLEAGPNKGLIRRR